MYFEQTGFRGSQDLGSVPVCLMGGRDFDFFMFTNNLFFSASEIILSNYEKSKLFLTFPRFQNQTYKHRKMKLLVVMAMAGSVLFSVILSGSEGRENV